MWVVGAQFAQVVFSRVDGYRGHQIADKQWTKQQDSIFTRQIFTGKWNHGKTEVNRKTAFQERFVCLFECTSHLPANFCGDCSRSRARGNPRPKMVFEHHLCSWEKLSLSFRLSQCTEQDQDNSSDVLLLIRGCGLRHYYLGDAGGLFCPLLREWCFSGVPNLAL